MPHAGGLTTHILDTAHGCPAASVRVRLYRLSQDGVPSVCLKDIRTNAEGRAAEPLLSVDALIPGRYRLEFEIAEYFMMKGLTLPDPPFLDVVTITFGIAEKGAHYHVPLLVSPFGYSTYRGS